MSLDETYERVLKEIATANQHHACRLLQCLTVACRPLRVQELAEILALDFDGAKEGIPDLKEDWRWKDQQEAVLSTCSSLIAVVDDGPHRVVQFSHFSVKEFLTSDRLATSSADVSHFHIRPEPAHTVIVKACLGILLQSDNGVGDAKAKSSSLAKYAAKHWVDHAHFEKVSTSVEDGMRRLFDSAKPHFVAWLKLYDIDTIWNNFASYDDNTSHGSPLYYASLCGFRDLAAHLVDEHPQHVNARLGQNYSPLVVALRNKHFFTAELLHQRGANVGIRGYVNRTLLHAASVHGFVDIAQWLLARGGDANSREDNRETPLHLAVKNGRIEFVRILLRHGAIVNAKNKDNRTSLHLASEDGHAELVRLLLQHGADVATQDLRHSTPLHLVSSLWVSVKTARLLLQHRADVKEQNDSYSSPYYEVKSNTRADTVRVLLEHGADVTARDDTHSTPLHVASSKGSPEVVRLLIKYGADVNAQDGSHKTSLLLALSSQKLETMQLLIKNGADVNVRDGSHNRPLHLASSKGSPEIVRLLIKHGADINALDGNRKTPLLLASSWVSVKTARLLLQHRAHVKE